MLASCSEIDMSHAPDEELGFLAAHDFDAFAELYRRHLCRIYRFVRSKTPDESIAEDLTAQIFFRALSSANTFRARGSYQAWLFQIAHNVLSSWRGRSDRVAVGLDNVPDTADLSPGPSSTAIHKEAGRTVWRAVATLPPAQQEVIKLRYLHDLSTDEIGRATKRTQGAVRVLLHRARARLRHLVEGRDLT